VDLATWAELWPVFGPDRRRWRVSAGDGRTPRKPPRSQTCWSRGLHVLFGKVPPAGFEPALPAPEPVSVMLNGCLSATLTTSPPSTIADRHFVHWGFMPRTMPHSARAFPYFGTPQTRCMLSSNGYATDPTVKPDRSLRPIVTDERPVTITDDGLGSRVARCPLLRVLSARPPAVTGTGGNVRPGLWHVTDRGGGHGPGSG
jgi:hypothetical protein